MINNDICCFRKNYCMNNSFAIEVRNNGSFNARVSVNYFYNGHFIADSSGPLRPGYLYRDGVPDTAYNIVVRVYNLSLTPTAIVCQGFYEVPRNVTVSLWGTAETASCTESNILSNYSC